MSASRRGFLKGLLAGGAGAALISSGDAAAVEEFLGYPDRYGVLTDVSKCVGCRSCEKACNEWNRLPPPEKPFEDLSVLDETRRTTASAYTVVNRYESSASDQPVFRKTQCNHCNEPACVSACFVKALRKTEEGPVLWDETLCVGCRYCLVACPFYIPAYEYRSAFAPRVMKCTMCFDRLGEGRPPACVAECPTEAMSFGKLSDLVEVARQRIRTEPGKYVDHIYGMFEAGGTSWLYISHVPFEDVGLPTDLGTAPFPKYTKAALTWIPMIVVLWPAVLGGVYALSRRRRLLEDRYRREAVAKAEAETREAAEKKADQMLSGALAKAKREAEKEKKAAVDRAVADALAKAKGEGESDE